MAPKFGRSRSVRHIVYFWSSRSSVFCGRRGRIVETAPLSLLRQINYRSGIRLPKLVLLPREVPIGFGPTTRVMGPKQSNKNWTRLQDSASTNLRYGPVCQAVLKSPLLDFEHWEFRFWRIEMREGELKPKHSICRCCQ